MRNLEERAEKEISNFLKKLKLKSCTKINVGGLNFESEDEDHLTIFLSFKEKEDGFKFCNRSQEISYERNFTNYFTNWAHFHKICWTENCEIVINNLTSSNGDNNAHIYTRGAAIKINVIFKKMDNAIDFIENN